MKEKEMENPVQAVGDQQAQAVREKKPYETPSLTKLGNVKQLTQGIAIRGRPDDGFYSI